MTKKGLLGSAAAVALAAAVGYVVSVQLRPGNAAHAWLVFGPAANVRVRVTVAADTITLQPFAGEMPTGREERFKDRGQPLEITLPDPDGVTSYTIRKCASPVLTIGPKKGTPTELFVNVDVNGPVRYGQYSDIFLAPVASTAPVSHFHGPLAIGTLTTEWEVPPDLALRRGGAGTDLRATVGTMDAKRGCWVVVKAHDGADRCLFPDGVRPVADIEFPPKKVGDPPIRRRYALGRFC
jgi:hypothetical protein